MRNTSFGVNSLFVQPRRLAQLSQIHRLMGHEMSIAEVQRAGVGIRASEAVAIVQKLIHDRPATPPEPPFAAPSPQNVILDEQGHVNCRGCDVKPAVFEMGLLLEAMLPPGTRMPGSLHYTIARALLNVDAPPFASIEEFSSALVRFERRERDHAVRELVTRARAAAGNRDVQAAVIPFKHSPSAGRLKTERRRPMRAALAAELRRELRRADLERYARRASSTIPDLRNALAGHKHPIGVVVVGLAAGALLISSGEGMKVGAAAESLPAVAVPAPALPEAAPVHVPPADFFEGPPPANTTPAGAGAASPVARRASYNMNERRLPAGSRLRRPRGETPARAVRRAGGNGVLSVLRFQWMRSVFAYKRDL